MNKIVIALFIIAGLLITSEANSLSTDEVKIRSKQIKRLRTYILYKYKKYQFNDEESFWNVFETVVALDLALLKDMKHLKGRTNEGSIN